MANLNAQIDWSLAQSFVAVADTGSLSAAARKLGQSQPTIGRHIKALQTQLGLELFQRVPRGLELTPAAVSLLPHAREMARAAAALQLAADGRSDDLSGTVRITASVAVSHFILPNILGKLRVEHPEIQIELVPSDATENLIYREADIAVRMYRPEQPDVITRHVADQRFGLYAATRFLDRVGRPQSIEEAMALDFIGFDKSDLAIRAMQQMGFDVDREFFAFRCDDQAAYWHLVRAGCGVGAAQHVIGQADPFVENLLPDLELPPLPVWLTAPEALRHVPRIRAVWDYLVRTLPKSHSAAGGQTARLTRCAHPSKAVDG